MRYAWVKENIIIDICEGNPSELFHPEIAINFSTEIADGIIVGANWNGTEWINPPEIIIQEPKKPNRIQLTPMEFKTQFTMSELLAITQSLDDGVKLFYGLMNDIHLQTVDLTTEFVKDGVNYLVAKNLLTQDRANEILGGINQ